MMSRIVEHLKYSRQDLVRLGLLFVTYLVTALAGIALYQGHTSPVIIWPPAGIAIAGLFLGGYRLWPAVALGSFTAFTISGLSPLLVLPIAAANAVQAVIGVYLLHAFEFNRLLSRLRDAFIIVLVAFSVTMLVPAVGVLTFLIGNLIMAANPISTWGIWWSGEILSVLVLVPLIVRWLPQFTFKRTLWEHVEIFTSFAITIGFAFLAFWTPYTSIGPVSIILLSLIPLFWIALRLGPRAMTFALFALSTIALTGVVYGTQAPPPDGLADRLLSLEILLISISTIFLLFVATEEERKEGAQKLQAHVEDLEVVLHKISSEDRAKTEFLATLAHELRNPMAPILSSIELIRLRGVSAPESQEFLTVIEDRVQTMSRLLDDLLDISRISRKKFKLQKEPVQVSEIIRKSAQTAQGLMDKHGHTFSVALPDDDVWVEADPLRLEQVLINILNNAAKYTEPGGRIDVSCTRESDRMAIRVRDTGIGIDPAKLSYIFKPFQQIRSTGQTEGLGIGLSLTKRLVELHGGKITAHSKGLGHGSEFIIYLPIPDTVQLPMTAQKKPAAKKRTRARGQTILVVDDNVAAAEGLCKLLEYKGHTVALAHDGKSALEAVSAQQPTVILLDIGLPDMDGYDVARKLRSEQKYSGSIIALTGYGQQEDRLRAQQAGFDHHLTKPVGIDDVEAVLPQK